MARPSNIKYAESHEWAKADGNIVTIGLTDFAIEQLNDLTYVDLPEVGDKVEARVLARLSLSRQSVTCTRLSRARWSR